MAEDIKERLSKASAECLKCYEAWRGNEKDEKARECMQDAIHELRKVSSRLEIELAISERDQMAQKPIPIPPHRASRNKGQRHQDNGDFDNDSNHGNSNDGGGQQQPKIERKPQRRRTPNKKASGGE